MMGIQFYWLERKSRGLQSVQKNWAVCITGLPFFIEIYLYGIILPREIITWTCNRWRDKVWSVISTILFE